MPRRRKDGCGCQKTWPCNGKRRHDRLVCEKSFGGAKASTQQRRLEGRRVRATRVSRKEGAIGDELQVEGLDAPKAVKEGRRVRATRVSRAAAIKQWCN